MVKNLEKYINSKNDIYGLKTKWPKEIAEYLKKQYSKAVKWTVKGELLKKADGKEDENHKIEKQGSKLVQLEKNIDLEADIFKKFGFSEPELTGLIKKIELNII